MAGKWYKKAGVQAAFVYASAAILVVMIPLFLGYSKIVDERDACATELADARIEIQRLDSQLIPFRTVALQRFPGDEVEALAKLAGRLAEVEARVGEVRAQQIELTRHEFRPLSEELRTQTEDRLREIAEGFARDSIAVTLSHETSVNADTRRFMRQLARLLQESGIRVVGPERRMAMLGTSGHRLEWRCNADQFHHLEALFEALRYMLPPQNPKKGLYVRRSTLPRGELGIHFVGTAVFNEAGAAAIE